MKYQLKTEIKTGRMVGVPVAAAAPKVPPQIELLLKRHGLEARDYSVAEIDAHFRQRKTSIDDRCSCKAVLNQIGALK
jgi:hypothetical protein